MLANFLNKSKPINFVGLLVVFFLSFLIALYNNYFQEDFSSTKLIESVVFTLFFLFIFFLANFIIVKNNLTFDNSYAFYFFILLCIILLPNLFEAKILILGILYFLILRKIYSLRSSKNVFEKVFDASFWLGILFILEPLTFMFLMLIYFAIYFHKKLSVNTLIIPIIGFATPIFLYYAYLLWIDNLDAFYDLFKIQINFSLINYSKNALFSPFMIILGFTVFCLLLKSNKALSINNTFKRSWVLIMINFFLTLFYLSLHHEKSYASFIFIIFPTALILANGIELFKKEVIKDIVLYLFLAGSISSLFLL